MNLFRVDSEVFSVWLGIIDSVPNSLLLMRYESVRLFVRF
jgi:predicted O-linked N-acetylglucosamine transferase (SPINDLY family)